jgi:putative transposase/transposase-like zinc-binding protein
MIAPATQPRLELADILRAHGESYRACHPVSPEQAAVMRHLAACRTAALGGHVDSCGACGFVRVSYNSCRDRHCPKCQATKRAEWLDARLERLLPVEYFHVVFTLPEQLQPLALKNRRVIYNLLFQAAAQTLLALAADPQRLGAQIGFTAILHTWGQNLLFHPHLHCVVTGGGLSADGQQWIAGRPGYFLPVRVLSRLFRGKFLAGLKQAYQTGKLRFTGSVAALAAPRQFQQLLGTLYRQNFVVYAKPPFGGAEHVYRYLGRYTHRVAISNARLVSLRDGRVRFRYKDYAHGSQIKEMTLSAEEFLRRFLLHVLPKGFVRIRHYGLLAGRNVTTKLERSRQLLGCPHEPAPSAESKTWAERLQEWTSQDFTSCPHCGAALQRQPLASPTQPAFRPTRLPSHAVPALDSS